MFSSNFSRYPCILYAIWVMTGVALGLNYLAAALPLGLILCQSKERMLWGVLLAILFFAYASHASSSGLSAPSSLVLQRDRLHDAVDFWVREKISHPQVQEIFSALACAKRPGEEVTHALQSLGVYHLVAISGFHFALVIRLLQIALAPFFDSYRKKGALLLLLLLLYALFLGASPSIARAAIMAFLALLAPLINRRYNATNGLGAATILLLWYRPTYLTHVGFHLSFLATAAILLLYPVLEERMRIFWPEHTRKELSLHTRERRFLLTLLRWFRHALSLNLAVTLATAPLLLSFFGRFPLLSLVTNLFAAPLVSLAFVLFLLAALCSLVSGLFAFPLFWCSQFLLQLLLDVGLHARLPPYWTLYSGAWPPWLLSCYLVFLFLGGLALDHRQRKADPLQLL